MPDDSNLVNQAELAKILGITPQTLCRMVANGRITVLKKKGVRNMFDPVQAKKEFDSLNHYNKKELNNESSNDNSGLPSTAESVRKFNYYKSLREEANFKLTQLELDTQSKKFIPAELVKKDLYAAGNSMRVAIESIPIRYGHLLAGGLLDLVKKKGSNLTETEVLELVNKVIKSECNIILKDLQNELAKI
jgi:hypothetical protein